MATITITYVKPVDATTIPASQICATYVPANAAADNPVFDGTYYDTNVAGYGDAMSLDAFFAAQVAHPGLIAALRAAIRLAPESYDWEATDADVQYVGELAPALAEQGFTFGGSSSQQG